MARKVLTKIKLQAVGGQASPAPPVGPALGQHGVNIMEFVKAFNAQTQADAGTVIPVVITVYEDRSFTFITKSPPAAVLIKQALALERARPSPTARRSPRSRRRSSGDRREEDEGPQRQRHRRGREDHRRHRAVDGRRRGLMAKHGKAYIDAKQRFDREREYTPAEAIALVKQLGSAKFNESVEVHVRTGLNVRHADEQLRGTIALPNGLGKDVKIAVFAQGDKAREAEEAGADVVGAEDLAKIQDGFDDFDVAIATPDLMPVVGRLGRILGPAGKMPNPKVGTVTMDVAKAVEESKAGKVEYRTDRTAIVHLVIGKSDFDDASCSRTTPR